MDKRLHRIDYTGWKSNIFGFSASSSAEGRPDKESGLWIDIVDPSFVSRPCWEALVEGSAEHVMIDALFIRDTKLDHETCQVIEYRVETQCHRFIFDDLSIAKQLALRVQKSAKDKRREKDRRSREAQAEGFHTKACIDRIFEIQQGRCYYSGEPLTRDPNNFSRDHIFPTRFGGTDWPENIALALKGVNSWKGATNTKEMTLRWLSRDRGVHWYFEQLDFCEEVDRLRAEYDQEFRRQMNSEPAGPEKKP